MSPRDLLDPERLLRLRTSREARDSTRTFLCEGARFVHAARASGAEILGVVHGPRKMLGKAARLLVLRSRGVPIRAAPREEIEALSIREAPDGIVAVVRQRIAALPIRASPSDVWLALEHVRSPGNLGTLLRTASATAARGVVALDGPPETIDLFDPRVVRASMGALFALSLVRATPAELARWARRSGARVVGTSAEAVRDFRDVEYARGPTVLMLGSERRGLSPAQRELCGELVAIPMEREDSLNVSVAGSLLLYEAYRAKITRRYTDRPLRRRSGAVHEQSSR